MEQDRIHIKLARRTPEERQADETRRLDPFMRALKAIHTAAGPSSTATGAAIPAATWAIPVFWPPSWPTSPAGRCSPSSTASPRSTPIPPRWRTP